MLQAMCKVRYFAKCLVSFRQHANCLMVQDLIICVLM